MMACRMLGAKPLREPMHVVGMLLIGSLWTNFSEILTEMHTFENFEMSSEKWRPFSIDLNVLTEIGAWINNV